jgi:hypothetical protein
MMLIYTTVKGINNIMAARWSHLRYTAWMLIGKWSENIHLTINDCPPVPGIHICTSDYVYYNMLVNNKYKWLLNKVHLHPS